MWARLALLINGFDLSQLQAYHVIITIAIIRFKGRADLLHELVQACIASVSKYATCRCSNFVTVLSPINRKRRLMHQISICAHQYLLAWSCAFRWWWMLSCKVPLDWQSSLFMSGTFRTALDAKMHAAAVHCFPAWASTNVRVMHMWLIHCYLCQRASRACLGNWKGVINLAAQTSIDA